MIWTIEWNTEMNGSFPGIDGRELHSIRNGMADAIEDFLADTEFLLANGLACDDCGTFAICAEVRGESETPTDRGVLREEQVKHLCATCRDVRFGLF